MYFDKCDVIYSNIAERGSHSAGSINLTIEPTVIRQSCNIQFSIQETASITVTVYNSAGLRRKEVFSGILQKGPHAMTVATSDLPAGVYFLILQKPDGGETVKFVVAR